MANTDNYTITDVYRPTRRLFTVV